MTRDVDPSLNRRRLRIALRRAREEAGLTQADACAALEWSLSKVLRIEAGSVSLTVTDLRAMLQLYGVTDPADVADLETAARGSKGPSWWAHYNDFLHPQFAQYLGYEGASHTLLTFHPVLVPALLQTDEYASALLGSRQADGSQLRRAVELRTTRQERILDNDEGPETHFVVDESALYRQVGGADVLRRQLKELKRRAGDPRVRLSVLPFAVGALFGSSSPFIVLTFRDDDDLLYLETAMGSLTNRDDLDLTARYQETFATMTKLSVRGDDLTALLDARIAALGGDPADD
ncbi:helix-turn-helix transcriptional regulator [Streptomyces sp. NPDC001941]|uniref:helix-turn-helix domain-containing protein n=1 Tax=Streptomyces sp. NPDC001941 TaxID=3154659 RepID=UPI0033298505